MQNRLSRSKFSESIHQAADFSSELRATRVRANANSFQIEQRLRTTVKAGHGCDRRLDLTLPECRHDASVKVVSGTVRKSKSRRRDSQVREDCFVRVDNLRFDAFITESAENLVIYSVRSDFDQS